MPDSNEEAIKSCNSVAEIRRVEAQSNLPEDMLDCIEPVKTLLTKITEPLDPEFNLSYTDKISVKVLTPKLKQFLTYCCLQHHYFFEVRKGVNAECGVCGRVRLSTEEFSKIKLFPDPMMKDDGHFKSFEELHGADTSENDIPSLK